jgi:hypothetical protein
VQLAGCEELWVQESHRVGGELAAQQHVGSCPRRPPRRGPPWPNRRASSHCPRRPLVGQTSSERQLASALRSSPTPHGASLVRQA